MFECLFCIFLLQPAPPDEDVEQSTGLFDGSSDMFLIAMASMCGLLGVAAIAGFAYQYRTFIPQKNKGKKNYLISLRKYLAKTVRPT